MFANFTILTRITFEDFHQGNMHSKDRRWFAIYVQVLDQEKGRPNIYIKSMRDNMM